MWNVNDTARTVFFRPVYPRKCAPAKTCTWPYYASVYWYGGKILQSNAAAKMCTNRVFVRPTPCILHTHCILHTVVLAKPVVLLLSFDWQIWSDWLWRFCTRHFQLRICRGTKPVSSGSPFIFILFSLQLFRLSKEVHTISPSNIAVHVNCTQATLVQLTKFLQVPVFHSRFILHSPLQIRVLLPTTK